MPGYKALPSFLTGHAADQVRAAESRHKLGDSVAAALLLEDALVATSEMRAELPGWLCGRLAALYRTLGRYDDEVMLLERYRESQTLEEARTRYDARLSKARTIAERKRRPESGALSSVRAAIGRPRPRRAIERMDDGPRMEGGFSPEVTDALRAALAADSFGHDDALRSALAVLCDQGHAKHAPVEQVVDALKEARDHAELSVLAPEARQSRYGAALLSLLALYLGANGA